MSHTTAMDPGTGWNDDLSSVTETKSEANPHQYDGHYDQGQDHDAPSEWKPPHTHANVHSSATTDKSSSASSQSSSHARSSSGRSGTTNRPPPDHHLNGPNDYMALIPITITAILTLITLYLCAPSLKQWSPPVDGFGSFVGFEYPDRSVIGSGYEGWSGDGFQGHGGPAIAAAAHWGSGGVGLGTRSYWPIVGRRAWIRRLRQTLSSHPTTIVLTREGMGASAAISSYIDSTRYSAHLGRPSRSTSSNPRLSIVTSLEGSSEYNVIVWIDASSIHMIRAQFIELASYMRLRIIKPETDAAIANVFAWLYRQERWLIIFDNCQVERSELQPYIPRQGGHTLVVLALPPADPVPSSLHGFELSGAANVITLGGIGTKSATQIVRRISGMDFSSNRTREALQRALSNPAMEWMKKHPASLVVLSLWIKRHDLREGGAEMALSNVVRRFSQGMDGQSSVEFSFLSFILGSISSDLPRVGVSDRRMLGWTLSAALGLIPQGGKRVELGMLTTVVEAMALAEAEKKDEGAATSIDPASIPHMVRQIVRQLALYNLASELPIRLCGHVQRYVYFPSWTLQQLRNRMEQQNKHETDASSPSPLAVSEVTLAEGVVLRRSFDTSIWPHVRSLLLSSTDGNGSPFLTPLLHALSFPSSSSYFIPTPSIVATNPQEIPPMSMPAAKIYMSVLDVISMDAVSSPLRDVDVMSIFDGVRQAVGGFGHAAQQDRLTCDAARAYALVPHLHALLQWDQELDTILSRHSAAVSPPLTASSACIYRSRLDVMFLLGCFHVDVSGRIELALGMFETTATLAWRLSTAASSSTRTSSHPSSNSVTSVECAPNPLSSNLLGKSGWTRNDTLVRQHPFLELSCAPMSPYFISSLAALGTIHAMRAQPANADLTFVLPAHASMTMDGIDPSHAYDIALNYHTMAMELKRVMYERAGYPSIIVGAATDEGTGTIATSSSATTPTPSPPSSQSFPLHPSLSTSLSSLAAIHAWSRDLEGAKKLYSQSLQLAEGMKLRTISDEDIERDYMEAAGKIVQQEDAADTHGLILPPVTSSTSSSSSSSPVSTLQDHLLHHLHHVRDLSLLAHQESALFYYSNSLQLHTRCLELERTLYGPTSFATASRQFFLATVTLLNQRFKDAQPMYAQALESHKQLVGADQRDLRLVRAHFKQGQSLNSIGRGRAGRAEIELALSSHIAAIGGELHMELREELEVLGDTCFALSAFDAALQSYRRLLSIYQVVQGANNHDPQYQHRIEQYKNRIMAVYSAMTQHQEEQRRRRHEMHAQRMAEMQRMKKKQTNEQHKKQEL